MARGGNAGCNGCVVDGHVDVHGRRRLGAGGTVCGEGGGSGDGGGRAAGSAGLDSSENGDHGLGPAPHVLLVLCGAGWLGGVCVI